MAKDPAVLFYTSDFLIGAAELTNEQAGKYIRLLCFQHQKGHLSKEFLLKICETYDKDIFSKFQQDGEGNYFNERMDEVINKRKAYSESRRANRTKKDENICKTYDSHMVNENVIKNKEVNNTKEALIFLVQSAQIYWNNQKMMLNITDDQFNKLLETWAHENQYETFENDKHRRNHFRKYLREQVKTLNPEKQKIKLSAEIKGHTKEEQESFYKNYKTATKEGAL